jgi:hypothetical protein
MEREKSNEKGCPGLAKPGVVIYDRNNRIVITGKKPPATAGIFVLRTGTYRE